MKYEFSGRVRYSEIGEDGKLSLPALINYFQDCSTFQAETIGDGVFELKKKHRAWILASWQIELVRMPRLYEPVTAATWAYAFRHFFAQRNFTLTDGQGELAAKANSTWVFFDIQNQTPVNISEEDARKYGPEEPLAMTLTSKKIKIPVKQPVRNEESFRVERHHLDTNHHVNNGQYIQMAAAYLPERFEISGIRVEYRRQARQGDLILPTVCELEDKRVISLNAEDGKPYALLEFLSG